MVATAEASLNIFLESPQWWPRNKSETSCGSAEVPAQCNAREASHDRLQQLRLFLSEASFETVGGKAIEENTPVEEKRETSCQASLCMDNRRRLSQIKDVPPCFAPFTRFNCNVTLVAQRLFNVAMGVSVLCSGTATIEESRESFALQMWKDAKPGEVAYVRHVMLTAPECRYERQQLLSGDPFSYGFLVARLEYLSPQVRDLVLSERLPFGAILDRCGVRRSVETDRQLHVHLRSDFFDVNKKLPLPKKHGGSLQDADGEALQGKDLRCRALQTCGECQCKILPKGSCCTFGRLTTVWCDGKPAARVVEILNERFVLRSLMKEKQQLLGKSGENAAPPAAEAGTGSAGKAFQSRFAFLLGRCLMSVALCPAHCKLLPSPHVNARSLLRVKNSGDNCSLCGSKSCSTDFHSAYTADLR
ncbi:hypothetical protein, conserved [Eimeria acervulina]|uniref:Uncharacterized protein n=1 Tax=Eimeria acervulina TaxID=5801 RepID=U6GC35_EIMAC|nr:hypothetical protein, conserved [Eimeria acervulina]CDI76903.1 hypothetical protein, conserved [Eimeria acervulina]